MVARHHRTASISEIGPVREDYGPDWHSVRHHLGITGFGINVQDADAGQTAIEGHTEQATGDEELYVVVAGAIELVVDQESVELHEGWAAVVEPAAYRSATALQDGTRVVFVGGRPGAAYQAPDWDRSGGIDPDHSGDVPREGAPRAYVAADVRTMGSAWSDGPPGWRSVRREMGITSFGTSAVTATAGETAIDEHDETDSGHEELYLVAAGSADFLVDGDHFTLAGGDMVVVPPEVSRSAVATADDTLIYSFGAAPGKPYEMGWGGA
jgi:mannose-6-phosphate isomerase-like protein (cupin superfamily)